MFHCLRDLPWRRRISRQQDWFDIRAQRRQQRGKIIHVAVDEGDLALEGSHWTYPFHDTTLAIEALAWAPCKIGSEKEVKYGSSHT